MEAHWFAGLLIHPLAIAALVALLLFSAFLLYAGKQPPYAISPKHLASGYAGVVIVCLLIAAASSYVSPAEALTKWRVPAESYWSVLFKEFVVLSLFLVYSSLIGVAVIGAPITFALARRGLASVPWVLASSVVVSVVAVVALVQFSQPSNSSFTRDAPYLVGSHLLLALGFSIGARLPWRAKRTDA